MSQFGSQEKTQAALTGALVSAAAAITVALGPQSGYRVKRLGSSVGTLKWASQEGTADASNGYTLTASDPDSGWIPGDGDYTLALYATGGAVDYEIMRLRRS